MTSKPYPSSKQTLFLKIFVKQTLFLKIFDKQTLNLKVNAMTKQYFEVDLPILVNCADLGFHQVLFLFKTPTRLFCCKYAIFSEFEPVGKCARRVHREDNDCPGRSGQVDQETCCQARFKVIIFLAFTLACRSYTAMCDSDSDQHINFLEAWYIDPQRGQQQKFSKMVIKKA